MIIIGAGLAGLVAGNMLRRHKPIIYEAQPSLPNNHAALLRFRTDKVANATGIPFKKVKVSKTLMTGGECVPLTAKMQNWYSKKVTGEYHPRSIGSLEDCERYIAPDNFIEQAAANLKIIYSDPNSINLLLGEKNIDQVISTMPMNIMMDLVKWKEKPEFKFMPIWSINADIKDPCNVYQTIYYPGQEDYEHWIYRASITGSKLIIECRIDPEDNLRNIIAGVKEDFGIYHYTQTSEPIVKHQKYGKLLPIDDSVRKRFMLHLTQEYGIYSLGRFATWRQILMDDVVKDVGIIENMIERKDTYSNNIHWSSK